MAVRGYKRISYEERKIIEKLLSEGSSVVFISETLNRSVQSIYRELMRCKSYSNYTADHAQKNCDLKKENKGRKGILELDVKLAERISLLIREENLSPVEIIKRLRLEKYPNVPSSRNTIYSAIYAGLIPQVTRDTLLEKHKCKKTHMFSGRLVHIPSWICDQLELTDGKELDIDVIENKIVIKKSE